MHREETKKEGDGKEGDGKEPWGVVWGALHFWDNEKFIAPSPAASLNQRRICIADGPCRNKINLSLISRGGLKISPSLIYVYVVPWHREREVTATLQGAILFLHSFKDANSQTPAKRAWTWHRHTVYWSHTCLRARTASAVWSNKVEVCRYKQSTTYKWEIMWIPHVSNFNVVTLSGLLMPSHWYNGLISAV